MVLLDVNPTSLFVGIFLSLLVVAGWLMFGGKRRQPLPPMAPPTLFQNMMRSGYPSLPHKVEMSEWVCDNTTQDTSNGATFALAMPLPMHFFTTCDHKLMRIILAGSADGKIAEADKSPSIKAMNLFRNIDSVLTASTESESRSKARKFMAPAFSTLNLQKTTFGVLRDKTAKFVQQLRAASSSPSSSESACVVDMKELNVSVIFEVLAESLFGLQLHDDLDGFDCEGFLTAQNATLREAMRRTNNPLRKFMFWDKDKQFAEKSEEVLKALGATVLRKYREKQAKTSQEEQEEQEDGASIIGHLVDHDYASDEHRISDLIIFLIAGHETTAHSLSFFLYCIATNPTARLKLQAELDAALPALSFPPTASELEALSPSAISQLEYFSWCLKESQRLYPVAPVVGRQLQHDLFHNGFVLPKNSIVACHLYGAGRQRWIEDADQFRPERWSKEHPQYEQLKLIPTLFSMGKRSCIGQNLAMLEMRVIASTLLRNFDFLMEEELQMELFVTVKPISLKMRVMQR